MSAKPLSVKRCLGWAIFLTIFALISALYITQSLQSLYIVIALAVLEISLSFDNAVINARVLETMSPVWQRRFLIWGLPIAVFGMRLIFPIVLVYITSGMPLWAVVYLAWAAPGDYQALLAQGYPYISAFGGAFLFMVFLQFLLDKHRTVFWLKRIEQNKWLRRVGRFEYSYVILVFLAGIYIYHLMPEFGVAVAYLLGMSLYLILHLAMGQARAASGAKMIIKQGLYGFIYLELLDASFSMDGVLAAFAMTTDIFVIMLGLGIGAIYVRTFTLALLAKKTLKTYVYLEHGAYYAIGFLGLVLVTKNFYHVSELITASVGLLLIIVAFFSSWRTQS